MGVRGSGLRRAVASSLVVVACTTAVVFTEAATASAVATPPIEVLEGLKDHLTPSILAVPGVVWIDADESTGELAVGIDQVAATDDLREQLLSVITSASPAGTAVRFEVSSPVAAMNLNERHRPTVGGLQIQFQRGFLGLETGTCTYGFGARALAPAPSAFVTNSHCSRTQGSNDNGRYWSPTRPASDGDQIGTEVSDPAYTTGGTCPATRRCRRSDSALVQSTQAGAARVGHIARAAIGSVTWDGTSTYRITAKGGTVIANSTVLTKVGRTTGRSAGVVTNTCVNVNVADSDITLFCQNYVLANVEPGDSGSPVFAVTNSPQANDVSLHGIVWGRAVNTPGQVFFAYSPILNIEQELGLLNVLG